MWFVGCKGYQSYYGMYGGGTTQYQMYGSTTGPTGGMMSGGAAAAAAFYPYLQFGEGTTAAAAGYTSSGQGYGGVQYPHGHLFQYSSAYPQHYATPMSLAPSPALQSAGNFFFFTPFHDRPLLFYYT